MIYKMILLDVVPFSVVTMVFLFGFSHVVFLIGNWSSPEESNLFSFLTQIGIFFEGLIGNLSMDIMTNSNPSKEELLFAHNHPLVNSIIDGMHMFAPKMAAIFFIIMCIILLNLLVAMMGDTYSKITEDAKGEWQMQRAQIIFSIEQNMTDDELANVDNKYWVEVGGKRYLQLEEEDAHVFDKFMDKQSESARLNKLQKDKEAAVNAKQAAAVDLKRVQEREAKVSVLGKAWRRKSSFSADGFSGVVSRVQSQTSDEAGITASDGGDGGGSGSGSGGSSSGSGGGDWEKRMDVKLADFAARQEQMLRQEMAKLYSALSTAAAPQPGP